MVMLSRIDDVFEEMFNPLNFGIVLMATEEHIISLRVKKFARSTRKFN